MRDIDESSGFYPASRPRANDVAAYVQNYEGSEVFGSWFVDITCSDGNHSYVSSDGTNTNMWAVTETGTFPNCVQIPPAVSSGNWYDKGAALSGGTAAVVVSTSAVTLWSKRIMSPLTGLPVGVLSINNAAGHNGFAGDASSTDGECHDLYFQQTFAVTEVAPIPGPTMGITKTVAGASNPYTIGKAGNTSDNTVTMAINICNSGGPETAAVTMLDDSPGFNGDPQFSNPQVPSRTKGYAAPDSLGAYYDWSNAGVTFMYGGGFPAPISAAAPRWRFA